MGLATFNVKGNTRKLQRHLKYTEDQRQVKAYVYALNRTANKIKSRSAKETAREMKIRPAKVVRERYKVYRAKFRQRTATVSVGTQHIPLKRLKPKQNRKGVRASGRVYEGAFMGPRPGAIALSLHGHVFRRKGDARLPIEKLSIAIKDRAEHNTAAIIRRHSRAWFNKDYERDMKRRLAHAR